MMILILFHLLEISKNTIDNELILAYLITLMDSVGLLIVRMKDVIAKSAP